DNRDEPGKRLCEYMVKHSTIEFAAVNYRRALSCIGVDAPGSPIDAEGLPPSARARTVKSKRVRSELLIEFDKGSDGVLPALSISAGALKEKPLGVNTPALIYGTVSSPRYTGWARDDCGTGRPVREEDRVGNTDCFPFGGEIYSVALTNWRVIHG